MGQHSKKGRGRRGWWLLPTGTGHGWAVAAVRKTPMLRQQESPAVDMQTTHKICKHHRAGPPLSGPWDQGKGAEQQGKAFP